MRKLIVGLSTALALLGSVPAVIAADVTITVTGQVVAKPCDIETTNANVDLGGIPTFSLASAGAASDWKTVTLNLNNCPIGTSKVTATFAGTSDSTGSYFLNQGTATNVAVQLANSSGTNLSNGGSLTSQVDDSSLSTAFNLEVRAITPSGSATQGSITSTINVTYTWQ
ncbi:fimbrial protein [Tatumella saanichensis]|uniref:fimbrial protein n=1 Tax=Tatumella saanichensis TaxID=480813 RepID=UPI0004A44C56|nr:fimbrial protein [Tatumella saanichensis]